MKAGHEHPAVSAARERAPLLRRKLLDWWRVAKRSFPWREQERGPYEVLVAELLLKRTTATAAARIYNDFLTEFPSVTALDSAPQPAVERALVTVGLHRQRAQGLKQLARYILETEGGSLPQNAHALAKLPHVGAYSAAAVASFAHGESVAVLDSNVERILRRLFGHTLATKGEPATLRTVSQTVLAPRRHREFNLAMLDLGALVCRYDRPRCEVCPLQPACDHGAIACGVTPSQAVSV